MSEDALLHVRVWVCEWLSVTVFRGKNIITKPESCLRDRQNIHKKKKKKKRKKTAGVLRLLLQCAQVFIVADV